MRLAAVFSSMLSPLRERPGLSLVTGSLPSLASALAFYAARVFVDGADLAGSAGSTGLWGWAQGALALLVGLGVYAWLSVGSTRVWLGLLRGKPASFGTLVSGKDRWWDLLRLQVLLLGLLGTVFLATLLCSKVAARALLSLIRFPIFWRGAVAAGFLAVAPLSVWLLGVRLSLAGIYCVDGGFGPVDAINHSWQQTSGRVWKLYLPWAVLALAGGASSLLGSVWAGLLPASAAGLWSACVFEALRAPNGQH